MAVLVTGGAGYIGSVTAELLTANNIDYVVLDNLVYGHLAALAKDVPFYEGDVGDAELVAAIIKKHQIESCIHFAAFAYVGESVTDPSKYFENNTVQTYRLLDTLIGHGIKKFVFSSTCATYGDPVSIPIDEAHPQKPVNPYGWTKFMIERILESFDTAYGLKFVALRYFNAAGATALHGEHHEPETHLIPNVLKAAGGELPRVSVFGDDYPTPDGTCIRDYIHVADLADAHLRALDYLGSNGTSTHLNLGNGTGFSVTGVIETARRITGRPIDIAVESRRPGDPPRLIADSSKAFETLGWKPQIPDIEDIVKSAWEWKENHPNGYTE